MENNFFPYTTRDLMETVQQEGFKVDSYLRDNFFKNTWVSAAKHVAFDEIPGNDRALAPFVNSRIGGVRIGLEGYKTNMYEPPVVGNYFTVSPEDTYMRAPGQTEYNTNGGHDYLRFQISNGFSRIEDMISRREEWMCAHALIHGHIPIVGEGVSDEIQYWSQLDASEQPKTTLTNKWSETSVTPNDIINDLNEIVDTVVARSGRTPQRLICGKTVYKTLREKFSESKMLDMKNVEMGHIQPMKLTSNVRRLGYLADPGIEIYSYGGLYNDASGKLASVVPDDVCLFMADKVDTVMAYGGFKRGWQNDGAPSILTGQRISFEEPIQSLEKGRSIYLQSRPLPIIQSTAGFHVLKAL